MNADTLNTLLDLRDQVQSIMDSTELTWSEKNQQIFGGTTLGVAIVKIIQAATWYDSNMSDEENLKVWFNLVQEKIAQIQSQQ